MRTATGSSRPSSRRMRSTTAGSMPPRPSSIRLEMKLPGMTLNSTNTTSATPAIVGTMLTTRFRIRRSMRADPYFAGDVASTQRYSVY